ncbi:F-box/FBD/LRR-repeat protein At5g22660-like isoform X1 [Triticum urartu]|uniref:F-box/FBD/LRR-repeat protein At5g22660-like isoform X1 n=2 Tax=Triticum urartu TaxID=4572 RepID=UPI002044A8B7|nr:F-box/FBD/LRR-repeat protein At5g22660-like isoform X1 [Triticum urartu]
MRGTIILTSSCSDLESVRRNAASLALLGFLLRVCQDFLSPCGLMKLIVVVRAGNLFEKMLQGGAGRGSPRDGAAGGGGRDRISDLTDDLCHHVFSYMKAWEVVRTSALSRRWRRTWASAPCLDIRRLCACSRRVDQDWYAEFVKHLLLRRDRKSLNTLRLHWNHDDANTWIVHALRHNATAIQLSAKHHRPILKLDCTVFLSGNLNILQLANVSLDSRSLSGLCSRCTSLEELELRKALIYATEIRSTSLKRLTMVNCKIFNDLTVDASNLAALRCIRPCSFVPQIKNSGSLVAATIMLDDACLQHARPWSVQDDEDDGDTYTDAEDSDVSESQTQSDDDSCAVADEHARDCEHPGSGDIVVYGGKRIFHSLSNVRTMNLSAHRGEVLLTTELENCPVFENLRTLSLGEWCIDSEFNALSTMLEKSPNLENIFIHLDKKACNSRDNTDPSETSCTYNNLKVKISYSGDDKIARQVKDFFLTNNGSWEKRKAQGEAAESSAKQRRVRSPEGGQGGGN